MAEINRFLEFLVNHGGSDLMMMSGSRSVVRVHGELKAISFSNANSDIMTDDILRPLVYEILSNRQIKNLEEEGELDLAYELPGVSRFRSNVYFQSHGIAIAFRAIPSKIRTLEELGFPEGVKKLASIQRGFVLVCGPSGCGKTTTLAAMVDYVNKTRHCHIITIEEPIEYLHSNINSIITQRQVGPHTDSFSSALRVAVRQDPDVIMVGEMRDLETIETALTAAETGHLVMSTLHTLDAAETINRIISVFPPYHQRQVRMQLSNVIKGVISQRLVPRADGKGRVPAVEVMISTGRVRECIDEKEKTKQLHEAIAQGVTAYGMQTFDQSLMSLYTRKLITYEEALRQSSNPDDFALKISGISSTSDLSWDQFEHKDDTEEGKEKIPIDKFGDA